MSIDEVNRNKMETLHWVERSQSNQMHVTWRHVHSGQRYPSLK